MQDSGDFGNKNENNKFVEFDSPFKENAFKEFSEFYLCILCQFSAV